MSFRTILTFNDVKRMGVFKRLLPFINSPHQKPEKVMDKRPTQGKATSDVSWIALITSDFDWTVYI